MSINEYYEFLRTKIVEYILVKFHEEVTQDKVNIIWTTQAMEIHRAVAWVGDRLFIVTHNENTGSVIVDAYEKV